MFCFSETAVEIEESVRGKDVYIIQTGTKLVSVSSFLCKDMLCEVFV